MENAKIATQLSFFAELDHDAKIEAQNTVFLAHKKLYEEWIALPDETLVSESSLQRENLADVLNYGYLFGGAHHVCKGIPEGHIIWMNGVEKNYWVLRAPGKIVGTHVEICPFCGANLAEGEGDAVLLKGDKKHWAYYIHYEVPVHTFGVQSKLDRTAMLAAMG